MDPYKMVYVNIIASLVLLTGVIFYKFVYPKKKINLFILLILISILPIISIFRAGDYQSGDFNIHIYRIMSFYDSLKEGIIMPSWAGELNANYGNPLFIFNYSLPYYVISFFHFLGIGFIEGTKLYLGLVLYLSGIAMYLFMKEAINNERAAFVASIFYIFSPYHLIDIHLRATLGESTIFLLIPFLLLSIIKYFKKGAFIYLIWGALFTDLLFLAHPLLGGVFLGVALLYSIFFHDRNFKKLLFQTIALLLGALASIYTWSPFILYSSYMFKFNQLPDNKVVFYPFHELFLSPWRYGLLFQGPKGELAQIIGYTQIVVIILSIIIIIFKRVQDKLRNKYIFWVLLCLLTIFFMNPVSIFFWDYVPNISSMLVSFGRLSLALSLFTSVIAAYFVISTPIKKRPIIISFLVLITIGYTILNWGHRTVIPEIVDNTLKRNVWSSTLNEGTTAYFLNNKWADVNNFWFSKIPEKHLEIINGKGTIKETKRTSIEHDYIISAQTPLVIKENTLYYPGWNLFSNSNLISIYPGNRGIINAKLPSGKQNLELKYNDIQAYTLTKLVSGFSLAGFLFLIIYYYIKPLFKRKIRF